MGIAWVGSDAWLGCDNNMTFTVCFVYNDRRANAWCIADMTVDRHTMAKDSNVVWNELDTSALSKELGAAYEKYKVAQRAAAELRTAFESAVNDAAGLPEGKKLVFGYRFGKLSAAIVDDDGKGKAKAASPAKLSLSDFMAMTAGQGKRI
jgi:hypothetical protein